MHDGTERINRLLQETLKEFRKTVEISEDIFQDIPPTGSVRPRFFGMVKAHEEGTPLRPILSMFGSPQHATVLWRAILLKLVH